MEILHYEYHWRKLSACFAYISFYFVQILWEKNDFFCIGLKALGSINLLAGMSKSILFYCMYLRYISQIFILMMLPIRMSSSCGWWIGWINCAFFIKYVILANFITEEKYSLIFLLISSNLLLQSIIFIFSRCSLENPYYLCNKMAQLFALVFAADFPTRWPDFIHEVSW